MNLFGNIRKLTVSAENKQKSLEDFSDRELELLAEQVDRLIEVLFYSGISTVISSLLGTLAASVIFKLIDENAKPAALPFSAMIAVFVLMYAVMLCAYLLPLKNMSRTSIAQDIRMKE